MPVDHMPWTRLFFGKSGLLWRKDLMYFSVFLHPQNKTETYMIFMRQKSVPEFLLPWTGLFYLSAHFFGFFSVPGGDWIGA